MGPWAWPLARAWCVQLVVVLSDCACSGLKTLDCALTLWVYSLRLYSRVRRGDCCASTHTHGHTLWAFALLVGMTHSRAPKTLSEFSRASF